MYYWTHFTNIWRHAKQKHIPSHCLFDTFSLWSFWNIYLLTKWFDISGRAKHWKIKQTKSRTIYLSNKYPFGALCEQFWHFVLVLKIAIEMSTFGKQNYLLMDRERKQSSMSTSFVCYVAMGTLELGERNIVFWLFSLELLHKYYLLNV